jgi:hypothetical protein
MVVSDREWRDGTGKAIKASLAVLLALVAAAPAAAGDKGCDIEASSEVRVVPKNAPSSSVTTARAQTPCATIPNGYENGIGPIGVEVRSPEPEQGRKLPGGGQD